MADSLSESFLTSDTASRGHDPGSMTPVNGSPRRKPLTSPARAADPLHIEDLRPGQVWVSPLRTISADDVKTFSQLTGDFDPLHQLSADEMSSSKSAGSDPIAPSPFGRPVAHGLLGLSVLAGLGTEYPRAATLALVGVTDWEFVSPIDFGQRVQAETTLEEVTPHGRRAGRAVWFRKLLAADGRTLQQGRFITLVAARTPNRRKPK